MSITRTAMALLFSGALSTGALACLPPGAPGADVPHKHVAPAAKKGSAKAKQAAKPAAKPAEPRAEVPAASSPQ